MAAVAKNSKSSDAGQDEEEEETPWAVHIRDLKRRREEIEAGQDEVLNERLKEYERERNRRKKEAKMHRNYQIKYCEALYQAQERAANDLYNEAKNNIQTEMLNAINDDLYRYTGRREGEEEGQLRVSARNLRSKAVKEEEEAAKTKKKSKYGNGEDAPIDFALKHKDIVMASDGFFTFPDIVELCSKNQIVGIIQPGGSKNDRDVINAANKHRIPLVFTGIRHFKH